MKQVDFELSLTLKRTRKREFLDEMNRAAPWSELVALVMPFAPEGKRGRPPFSVETMLRLHFMQQWFGLSDPAMAEALHAVPLYREFAGLDNWTTRLPDESTILRFRHLLKKHKLAAQILMLINAMLRDKGLMLRAGTVVDATLIAAPSSTKIAGDEREPEVHQTKKGNQWYSGMNRTSALTPSRAKCTRSEARRPTSTTWSRPTRCCMETRPMSSGTPATKARTSDPTQPLT